MGGLCRTHMGENQPTSPGEAVRSKTTRRPLEQDNCHRRRGSDARPHSVSLAVGVGVECSCWKHNSYLNSTGHAVARLTFNGSFWLFGKRRAKSRISHRSTPRDRKRRAESSVVELNHGPRSNRYWCRSVHSALHFPLVRLLLFFPFCEILASSIQSLKGKSVGNTTPRGEVRHGLGWMECEIPAGNTVPYSRPAWETHGSGWCMSRPGGRGGRVLSRLTR
ncbi:hypothetical protein B0J18DRAFT_249457 [Chaetomium sp. MPI-SDFR-AT-0129]|nr:hypothetical protein B0J18DRAFT_249457 [Chaetomium sp. MPI-SDFR-AT-0129]